MSHRTFDTWYIIRGAERRKAYSARRVCWGGTARRTSRTSGMATPGPNGRPFGQRTTFGRSRHAEPF